jgi:hypothetical protein
VNMAQNEVDVIEEPPIPKPGELAPDASRRLQHAQVLPLSSATGSYAKSALGKSRVVRRNGKTVVLPTVDDLKYNAEMQAAELRFVEEDEVVKAARNRANPAEMFRLLLIQAAQNAASLTFQRIEQQKRGEDTSGLINRHNKALKEVASLQAELRELGQQTLDPRSENFQRVFHLWVENLKVVVQEILTPEQANLFYNKLTTVMENWEEQAESVLR